MEDLTKHQLILVTLLVTFVTSIATGIITFTLLSEAPVEVTQTINRVVEKTIEKVVPIEGEPEQVVTTVVVNEEDRVIDAIDKNEKSIVRLKTQGADGSQVVSGLGLVINKDGVIVTDILNYNTALSYSIVFFDGKVYPSGRVYIDNQNGLVFMNTTIPANDDSQYVFFPTTFGNSDTLKIGQTIVAISGKDSNTATVGRVRELRWSPDKKSVLSIGSDVLTAKNSPGSPAVNLSGEIVGIEGAVGAGEQFISYVPINKIKGAIPRAVEELGK